MPRQTISRQRKISLPEKQVHSQQSDSTRRESISFPISDEFHPQPTITDMHDKYCGDLYNIYLIQSPYKGNHKTSRAAEGRASSFAVAATGRHLCILALHRVNIVAVTTILVLHVGNGRSEHV